MAGSDARALGRSEGDVTPDPKALAVLLDAARACYGDDAEQVRWAGVSEAP